MRVMVIWPPHIPLYFNSAYHLMMWEVVAYLQDIYSVDSVKGIDAGVLNYTYPELLREIVSFDPELIAIHVDFDNVDGCKRIALMIKEIKPEIKILVYGRLASLVPKFFTKYNIDGIVYGGDWEAGIENYLSYLLGNLQLKDIKGLYIQNKSDWVVTKEGNFLPMSRLKFPNPEEVPYDDYNKFYKENIPFIRPPGVPQLKELPVPVARGCPIGCNFCIIKKYQGKIERRREVKAVLEYIEQCKQAYDFDYISFIAPTFTLDKNYIINLCKEIISRKKNIRWKCCTVPQLVDKKLIKLMGKSGCFRISFGVETLSPKLQEALLPEIKRTSIDHLRKVFKWCKESNIETNWLVMVGLPEEEWDDFKFTIDKLNEIGGIIRPAFYVPYDQITQELSEDELFKFNRYLIVTKKFSLSTSRSYYNTILKIGGI